MSRRRIGWLIGLLSVAMIGLIAFQFYWIQEVNKVNEERFTRSVQSALVDVTNSLARDNDILFLQQDVNRYMPIDYARLQGARDSIRTIQQTKASQGQPVQNPADFMNTPFFQVQVDEATGNMQVSFDFAAFMSPQFGPMPEGQRPDATDQRLRMERQMGRRLDQMQSSWRNHLIGSNNIFERINPLVLDTLIHIELTSRGIDLPYKYGVTQKNSDAVGIRNTSDEDELKEIRESELSANLFPMDLQEKDYQLSIHFPKQKNYLMKQALIPLTSSGILMLVIIGCFAYAIMVILRQKKLSEIKNDFINNMTHEFKTPIATVALATEALQDDDLKNNKSFVDRYVQVIKEENRRLELQVEKVLQIATLDKKDFKLKFENVNIHDIINKALTNINIMVEKREGEITSQLLASNSVIEADKVHLTNIIYNLLDNANKYSPDSPQIHIRTENISTGVILKISDHGIGMAKEAIEKIFDKFYRVSTGNVHDVKGFGLGLSYVKSVIDMHQGNISVKSEPEKGSTFKIYLPFAHV